MSICLCTFRENLKRIECLRWYYTRLVFVFFVPHLQSQTLKGSSYLGSFRLVSSVICRLIFYLAILMLLLLCSGYISRRRKVKMVFWVFGYSSLIWNPGFDYDERIVGFIKSYRRTFHLACIDHRGTPEFPARAATLEPEEGAICWGAALCVKDDEASKKVLSYLRVRECEYDLNAHVEFFTEESPSKPVLSGILVFITTPDKVNNKYYLGPAPLEDMANQIARASGPCGPNYEYLYRMEAALKLIGHEDEEVIELAKAVRRLRGDLNMDIHTNCGPRNLPSLINQNRSRSTLNGFSDTQVNVHNLVPSNGLNYISFISLSHMPCSPPLLKSQAL